MHFMVQPPLMKAPETEYVMVDEDRLKPYAASRSPAAESTPELDLEGTPSLLPAGEPLLVLPSVPVMASLEELHYGKLALVSAVAEEGRHQTLHLMEAQILNEVEEVRS